MKRPLVILGLCAMASLSAAQTVEEVLTRLEKAETEVQRLSFDFSQTTRIVITGESVESRGSALFERPNRFRVEQKAPSPQIIVGDGRDLWFHLPQRNQVIHDSMENWAASAGFPKGLTPFRFQVGEMKEKYRFVLDKADPHTPVILLSPADPHALPYTIRLWIDLKTGVARRTELSSASVTATTDVKNLHINGPLPRDAFVFRPPKGTDVLEMPSPKKELP